MKRLILIFAATFLVFFTCRAQRYIQYDMDFSDYFEYFGFQSTVDSVRVYEVDPANDETIWVDFMYWNDTIDPEQLADYWNRKFVTEQAWIKIVNIVPRHKFDIGMIGFQCNGGSGHYDRTINLICNNSKVQIHQKFQIEQPWTPDPVPSPDDYIEIVSYTQNLYNTDEYLRETITVNGDGEATIEKYEYEEDRNSFLYKKPLPVRKYVYITPDYGNIPEIVKNGYQYTYQNHPSEPGRINPQLTSILESTMNLNETVINDSQIFSKSRSQISLIHNHAQIIQTTRNGYYQTHTAFIYDSSWQYLLAVVKNCLYSEAYATISQYMTGDVSYKLPYEADVTLRNIPGAQVTTYEHKPFSGVAKVKDPTGAVTFYQYNNQQKLSAIGIGENEDEVKYLKRFSYSITNK